jgi:probable FeS assembly SUF system protein SufT
MLHEDFVLNRDCRGTLVPAGDDVILEKGTTVTVTQALGGTVTVRTDMGLFRISGKDLDAIGNGLRLQPKFDANEGAPFSEERVWEALKGCFDPEIPINIVDLGLIYDLHTAPEANGKQRVFIKMTLTAPGCGMGPVIANDAKLKVEEMPGVEAAEVTIVWEPQWTPHMITPDGRVQLGLD